MSLFFTGSSIHTLTHSPEHSHEYYEVILTLSGKGTSVIGGKEYPFAPGTIHIIPPYVIHSKHSESGFQDIYFHTDSLQLGSSSALQKACAKTPVILSDDPEQTMRKLLSVMLSKFRRQKKYDTILDSVYHAVLKQLNEWYERTSPDSIVNDIIYRITNSFVDPDFKVTEALLETGFNIDYIRRRFQIETGTTPNRYLTDLRLNYARHLLWHQKQLRLSIAEIALMSGYYDVCYFSRIFKKRKGISPTEYADRHQY